MAYQSITRRWLTGTLSFILLLLIAAEIVMIVLVRSYYYGSAQRVVQSSADFGASYMESCYGDSRVNFTSGVRSMVENFEDKDMMDLMAIDHNGRVVASSSGFELQTGAAEDAMPDYEQAINSTDRQAVYNGTLSSTGEHILAITVVCPDVTSEYSAIRYVASLTQVDQMVLRLLLTGSGAILLVLVLILLSNSYFIRSIVRPVREISGVAKQLSEGNMDARILKKSEDEIGQLGEAINQMADQIQQTERMKNEFISSVSHELRTPLTAIKGWSETMTALGENDIEMIHKGMRVISAETQRLGEMVEELLDFSRIQNGRFTLVKAKMDLLVELEDAVLIYTQRASRDGKTLLFHEPDYTDPVYGDKNRIKQVFINVIDNALKYSDPGDTVSVDAVQQDGQIIVTVADTGCGIAPEDLPRVTEKFYKANATRRGSGIGMAVVNEIVTLHGGTLHIDSTLGEGTTVTIAFPVLSAGALSESLS